MLPPQNHKPNTEELVTAPRIDHIREKITWSPEGSQDYKTLVTPHLQRLRETRLDAGSQASISVLLQLTNSLLSKTAAATNRSSKLGHKVPAKSARTPRAIRKAQKAAHKTHKKLKHSAALHPSLPEPSLERDALRSTPVTTST